MSKEDETKKFMQKLVNIIGNMSETLQTLEEKINISNRQMALLTKQVEGIASKIGQLDLEVEEQFVKLGKNSDPTRALTGFESELNEMERDIDSIPDDMLDDELKQLLNEDKEPKQEKK